MIKVGEYFRTPYGGIGKITDIPKHCKYFDDGFSLEHKFIECGRDAMKKITSTPNITDLLEIGDLMYVDISPDDCGGIVVPRIAETEDELKAFLINLKNETFVLKGIVTKELLEKNAYWVGD